MNIFGDYSFKEYVFWIILVIITVLVFIYFGNDEPIGGYTRTKTIFLLGVD